MGGQSSPLKCLTDRLRANLSFFGLIEEKKIILYFQRIEIVSLKNRRNEHSNGLALKKNPCKMRTSIERCVLFQWLEW